MIQEIEEDKDEVTGDVVVNMLQDKLELEILKKKTLIAVIGLESRVEEWKGQYNDRHKAYSNKKTLKSYTICITQICVFLLRFG